MALVPAGLLRAALGRAKIQGRVVRALLVREMMTRYGRRNIGFLWLIAEPLILTGGIILVWSLGHRATHGVPIVAFALTGYSLLTLWRQIVQRALGCFRANGPLFFHQNVRFLDTILARALLEMFGALAAFLVAYLFLGLAGFVRPVEDHLLLAGAWGLMSLFAFGIGLLVAAASEIWEATERFVPALMYLTLPFSGVFTMMAWLPEGARDVLLVSPLVHGTEMFRAGFMGDAFTFHYAPWYLAAWALGTVAAGLLAVRAAEERFHYV